MDDKLFINKYRPTKLKTLYKGYQGEISVIKDWIKNFNLYNQHALIVKGGRGIGKTLLVRLIIEYMGHDIIELNANNIKKKDIINDLIYDKKNNDILSIYNNVKKKKRVLFIDDCETIKLSTEKNAIIEFCKLNKINKIHPIIFAYSGQTAKFIIDIKKKNMTFKEFKLHSPTKNDLLKIIVKICKGENIKFKSTDIINDIITYSQHDIRRLINILEDLKLTFQDKTIHSDDFNNYKILSSQKNSEISIFQATKKILNKYSSISDILLSYDAYKVLLPLHMHENMFKILNDIELNKKKKKNRFLDILAQTAECSSLGDVIETNIYTNQNWFLQDVYGFITCVKPSYLMNNISKSSIDDIDHSSNLKNKSLKNINKKNILLMHEIIEDKNLEDLLYINTLIYRLMENEEYDKVRNIICSYNITFKQLETMTKIDKTLPKKKWISKDKKKLNIG